jgi:hypothetical protein
MSDVGAVGRAFRERGFRDVVVRTVGSFRTYPSADDALADIKSSPLLRAELAALDEASVARLWERLDVVYRTFEKDGACDFPMTNLVVGGAR